MDKEEKSEDEFEADEGSADSLPGNKGSDRFYEFSRQCTELRPQLVAFASKLLSTSKARIEAEDLAQQALVKALEFSHQFTMGTNLKAWLFRIIKNNFLNAQRSKFVGHSDSIDDVDLYMSGSATNGQESVAALEVNNTLGLIHFEIKDKSRKGPVNTEWVDQNIQNLLLLSGQYSQPMIDAYFRMNIEYRVVFGLVCLLEFEYSEVVETLGIPIGTVMSRLFRARKHMGKDVAVVSLGMEVLDIAEMVGRTMQTPDL